MQNECEQTAASGAATSHSHLGKATVVVVGIDARVREGTAHFH